MCGRRVHPQRKEYKALLRLCALHVREMRLTRTLDAGGGGCNREERNLHPQHRRIAQEGRQLLTEKPQEALPCSAPAPWGSPLPTFLYFLSVYFSPRKTMLFEEKQVRPIFISSLFPRCREC